MANNTRTIADPVDGGYHDWFELYNSGPADVDLSRLILANSLTNTTQFPIPPGYVVPAGGHLLVWADNNSGHNNTNDPALHVNFKLSAAGETIALFTPGGSNVDAVTFGQQTNDVSQGRWPDGNSGQFYYMITPTPGGANIVGAVTNHPPVLSPIADQSVNEGNPLMVAASAMDPDSGQTLTYSLDPGAPAGATIDAMSGVFTWMPTEAQGPGTYPVTIRVTDSGLPPLSIAETMVVTVNEVNATPVQAPIDDQTATAGTQLTVKTTA